MACREGYIRWLSLEFVPQGSETCMFAEWRHVILTLRAMAFEPIRREDYLLNLTCKTCLLPICTGPA